MPTLDNNSRGSNCEFVYDVSRPFSLICSRRVHSANMAIQIRKLSSNEAAQVFPNRRQMDVSEYTRALRQLQTGDSAEVELRGTSTRTTKRRMDQAAKELGYRLKWTRANTADGLYFQVLKTASGRSSRRRAEAPPATGTTTRRRGRLRRSAAA